MNDLIAFLKARLDEDEADIDTRAHDSGQCDYLRGVHLEPERALREVAAKRAILADYAATLAIVERAESQPNVPPGRDYMDAKRELAALRPVVCYLAAVDSDHPDYRTEWTP